MPSLDDILERYFPQESNEIQQIFMEFGPIPAIPRDIDKYKLDIAVMKMLDIADNTRQFFNDFTISELANYVNDEDWLDDISQPNYTIEHEIITKFSEEDL